MSTIETMIAEYELLKTQKEKAQAELAWYREKVNALSAQLGMDVGELLYMKVVSTEREKQAWNFGKEVVYITLEKDITEKGV